MSTRKQFCNSLLMHFNLCQAAATMKLCGCALTCLVLNLRGREAAGMMYNKC
jgi:hypothetical protein